MIGHFQRMNCVTGHNLFIYLVALIVVLPFLLLFFEYSCGGGLERGHTRFLFSRFQSFSGAFQKEEVE